MRVGIIIPDRGDRPELLKNCLELLKKQTLQPMAVELVNFVPSSDECDITKRYRIGYDKLRNQNLDVIAFVENDDYYAPDYLETMVKQWILNGKPNLIGTNYTIYYHIKVFGHYTMHHDTRSSAMSTLIKPDLYFDWCKDSEPYTDLFLWLQSSIKDKSVIFKPDKHICLGIKHGTGLCGGRSHVDRLGRYDKDPEHSLLKSIVDEESYKFYLNYFQNERATID